jgi:type II secretion system protein G
MTLKKYITGFTLVEMAVVLIILGFIIGAFVMPLTVQVEQSHVAEARKDLAEIKEALLGYAAVNGTLPCPDTNGDGIVDGCLNTNATATTGGNLPWSTLGLKSQDPWGQAYQYRVNNAFTTTFNLSTVGSGAGIIKICTDNTCAVTESSNVPLIVFSYGKNGSTQPPISLDEKENANLDGVFVNHDFVQGGFDDVLMWISINVLMNRMVAVGKLP